MTFQTVAIGIFAIWCLVTIGAILLASYLDRKDNNPSSLDRPRRTGGKARQIDTTGYRLGRGAHPTTDAGPKPKTAPKRADQGNHK